MDFTLLLINKLENTKMNFLIHFFNQLSIDIIIKQTLIITLYIMKDKKKYHKMNERDIEDDKFGDSTPSQK